MSGLDDLLGSLTKGAGGQGGGGLEDLLGGLLGSSSGGSGGGGGGLQDILGEILGGGGSAVLGGGALLVSSAILAFSGCCSWMPILGAAAFLR